MQCPVCMEEANEIPIQRDGRQYDCPNCGKFFLSRTADSMLRSADNKARTVLSHIVATGQKDAETPFEVYSTHIDSARNEILPSPAEQLDSLILSVGHALRNTPGEKLKANPRHYRAKLCAMLPSDVSYVCKAAMEEGLVQENNPDILRLTMKGWQRFESLKKGQTNSNMAFMAMPFDSTEIDTAFTNCFVPAVESAGFGLERVDTRPEAGSIDDRIRVQIRNSKFLIADLTDMNAGAYWEAGYAEGLGKKVIYTCKEEYFQKKGTHFDTRQFLTVVWKLDNIHDAATRLTAAIRNTFPTEAKMEEE